jgi:threonine dehydrogenase-like Zn-dependent dehydrogenase
LQALAVFPAERRVAIIDHPAPPPPGPGEALLRVLDVGVCGTDKEIASFEYGTPPAGDDHLVLGHECVAQVEAVGPGVTDLRAGDLAVPMVRFPCDAPDCRPCRAGEQDYCRTGGFRERGIHGVHGFMTEKVLDRADRLHPVPKALRSWAVLTEPLSIAEKALQQICDIQDRLPWNPADELHAVVLGAGPIGLLGAIALRLRDYRVWVYSLEPTDDPRAQLARDIGAEYLCAREHDLAALDRVVHPLDVVYEATGAPKVAFGMLPYLDHNGVFVFTGVPGMKPPAELDLATLMRNMVLHNQVLLGTVNAGRDAYAAAVTDLEAAADRWPGLLDRLITGRHALADHAPLLAWDAPGIKNVIRMREFRP